MSTTTSSTTIDYSQYEVYIESIQANIIGKLFESLNANVGSINIWFTPQHMTSASQDASHQCDCFLRLENRHNNFEHYYVENTVSVGINVPLLYKLIKDSIKSKNTIVMYVKKEEDQKFYIRVNNQSSSDCSAVKLLNIQQPELRLPNVNYRTVLSLSSQSFLQFCKTCGSTGTDYIRIGINPHEREFYVESFGQTNPGYKSIILNESNDSGLLFRSVGDEIFSSIFTLRLCHNIAKSYVLSDHVHIYLEPNQPIVFQYDCGNLGSIKFFLYPMNEQMMN